MAANQTRQEAPAPPRFQIASRLGGLRDTAIVADPFGTGATLTIVRNGSAGHKAWVQTQVERDPLTLVMMEASLTAETVVLTAGEEKIVEGEREKANADGSTPNPLLPVVDRLVVSRSEESMRRDAMRSVFASGRMTPFDFANQRERETLEAALFKLRSWNQMPDADGGLVPYSEEAARALLTNDTPLEGAGLDELILGVDAWTLDVEHKDSAVPPHIDENTLVTEEDGLYCWREKVIIPGLTLGLAYQTFILDRSRTTALFRDQVIGAAAKNSEPSSDLISSSGDGVNVAGA